MHRFILKLVCSLGEVVISFPPGNGLRIGGSTSGVAVVVAGSVKPLVGSDCVGLTVPVPGLTVPVPAMCCFGI